jgi:hypothetical protein
MTRLTARLTIAAALTGVAVLLTGCTAAPAPTRTPKPVASSTAAAINGLPAGVHPAAIPTAVPNTVEARKQVQLSTCTGSGTQWKAAGTIKNTTDTKKDYRITVFFTTPTATVVDSAQTTVSLDAGASGKWTAAKEFTTGGKLLCVLRGVG